VTVLVEAVEQTYDGVESPRLIHCPWCTNHGYSVPLMLKGMGEEAGLLSGVAATVVALQWMVDLKLHYVDHGY
jgi:hypothetical protein